MRFSARRPTLAVLFSAFAGLFTWSFALACEKAKAVPAGLEHTGLEHTPRFRNPAALALVERERILLTANERSGTVSIVDLKGRRVAGEFPVGESLSDLTVLPAPPTPPPDRPVPQGDGRWFLATDWSAGKLYLLARDAEGIKTLAALGVSSYPAGVVADKDGRRCFVTSLWLRKLSIVDVVRDAKKPSGLKLAKTISLPFAPRLEVLAPDGAKLIVADAFRGNLAVVNVGKLKVESVKSIPGHNIRGLAWTAGGRLLVSHQTLDPMAYSSSADVHWGSVISNVVRSLDRGALERVDADVLAGSDLIQLGDVGQGAGDPGALSVTKDGAVYVALAGVGEVASASKDLAEFRRIRVGLRPSALATSADGFELYIADASGDAVTIGRATDFRSPSGGKRLVHISLGPQPQLTALERGRRLFFDARLSHDHWMSCHSCHTDGQSSDNLADTLGDQSFGAAKRVPPLGGVAQTGPWAWNGSVPSLAEQVRKSLATTMHAGAVSDDTVRDLTEYLQSLEPAPPIAEAADSKSAVERGRAVFSRRGCGHCHVPPTYTSPRTYDVGLRDEVGNRLFNPPSLRGVSQRAALFHDGRAASLPAVFAVHHHPGKTELPADERADLLAFLRSL